MKLKYLKNIVSLEINQDKCNGCGMCINVCPHNVIEMKNKKAVITDKNACMECGACQLNCPQNAIMVNSGVGCAAAVYSSFVKGRKSVTCGDTGDTGSSCTGSGCCG